MALALPIIGAVAGGLSIAQSVFPGLLGGQQSAGAEVPTFNPTPEEQEVSPVLEDEIVSQTERNMQLRRKAASKSTLLTNLQTKPTTEDSLLRIIAEGN